MASMESAANSGIKLHKQLAMGMDVAEPQGDGIPDGRMGDKNPPLSRGTGRAPDAKKSGMPPCKEAAPFWEGGSEPEAGPGMVKVAAHTRNKPGMGSY